MANWQRKLRLSDIWKRAEDGEMTVQQLAAEIAKRMRKLTPLAVQTDDADIDDERDEIACEFEGFAGGNTATRDEFDSIMGQLYDWGDTPLDTGWPAKKVCWIEVM